MRKNLPVTNQEKLFDPSEKLISSTDVHGNIVDCNDVFVEVGGFTRDELIGQPHNIIRHPDMPALAFEVMWNHLKTGKPWMGLVKNRRKDGGYYWVNAYVTPVTHNGEIVGYESVRSCPKREDVERAEKLYTKINSGESVKKTLPISLPNIFLLLAIASFSYLYFWSNVQQAVGLLFGSMLIYAIWVTLDNRNKLSHLAKLLSRSFSHELAVQTYTTKSGLIGSLEVSILSQQAHLTTVINRIENAAKRVSHETHNCFGLVQSSKQEIDSQQAETIQVAAAMNEMTTTIAEVSRHVSDTATQADTVFNLAKGGDQLSKKTIDSINKLRLTVQTISESVSEVSEQASRIDSATHMIEQIADQTNLLALNAAIEAARAGEQGRGFAVVADEVRSLAKRTQDSTSEIYDIVNMLTEKSAEAVLVAEQGAVDADDGVENVIESGQMLNGIVSSIGEITDKSIQISAAVEEQAYVAEDINRQVVSISNLADNSATAAEQVESSISLLEKISDDLHELVVRFK